MLLEMELASCGRTCCLSGKSLAPGEAYFSTLEMDAGSPIRRDYCVASWQGAGENVVAWWRSRVPLGDGGKPKLAPQDVLLDLFAELAKQPGEAAFRYVLGLLLLRRRIVKLVETRRDEAGEAMLLDCPRRDEQFELRVAAPSVQETERLEQRLVELLYGGE